MTSRSPSNGVREVYTWTQLGNADMRALNERLGYVMRGEAITVRGPLPLRRSSPVAN
jgi:hypothetical protein